jgi:hypothetical protein
MSVRSAVLRLQTASSRAETPERASRQIASGAPRNRSSVSVSPRCDHPLNPASVTGYLLSSCAAAFPNTKPSTSTCPHIHNPIASSPLSPTERLDTSRYLAGPPGSTSAQVLHGRLLRSSALLLSSAACGSGAGRCNRRGSRKHELTEPTFRQVRLEQGVNGHCQLHGNRTDRQREHDNGRFKKVRQVEMDELSEMTSLHIRQLLTDPSCHGSRLGPVLLATGLPRRQA